MPDDTTATESTSIRDIIDSAKLREHTIRICFDGDLVRQHEELSIRLDDTIKSESVATSIADVDPAKSLAEEVRLLESTMREKAQLFKFRALRRRAYERIWAEHPGRPDKDEKWNVETFPPALIAACAIDPVMTVTEIEDLFDVINETQRDELFAAAFYVNQGSTDIPFSERASFVIRSRGAN